MGPKSEDEWCTADEDDLVYVHSSTSEDSDERKKKKLKKKAKKAEKKARKKAKKALKKARKKAKKAEKKRKIMEAMKQEATRREKVAQFQKKAGDFPDYNPATNKA